MWAVRAAILLALAHPCGAQQVYRCDTGGKVAYSDAPCVGAKVIDATPTQGMDKMTGQSRKGREVRRDEFNREFDQALRPWHGRSHDEMNTLRKRVYLPTRDQQRCTQLDRLVPALEVEAATAKGEGRARADVDLYNARKQFFDLKC